MSAAKSNSGAKDAPTFDQSLGRLEEIVAELEQGGLGLESSLERYKEGVALLKGCRERLDGFRKQVEELTADGIVAHGIVEKGGDPDAQSSGGDGIDTPF